MLSDAESMSLQTSALEVLQHAAEGFLVEMFEDGTRVALHARRRTLMLKDIVFLRYLKRDPNLEPPTVFKTRPVEAPLHECLLSLHSRPFSATSKNFKNPSAISRKSRRYWCPESFLARIPRLLFFNFFTAAGGICARNLPTPLP